MAAEFYTHVMSNARAEGNRISDFTQRLAKKLTFNSQWRVGIANMILPYSWKDIGTDEYQYLDVTWNNGVETRLWVQPKEYRTPQELEDGLALALQHAAGSMCKQERKRKGKAIAAAPRAKRRTKRGVDDEVRLGLTTTEELEQAIEDAGMKLPREYEDEIKLLNQQIKDMEDEKTRKFDKYTTEMKNLRSKITQLENFERIDKVLRAKLRNRIDSLADASKTVEAKLVEELTALGEEVTTLESEIVDANSDAEKIRIEQETQRQLMAKTLQETSDRVDHFERLAKQLERRVEELSLNAKTSTGELPKPLFKSPKFDCEVLSGKPYDDLHKRLTFVFDERTGKFAVSIDTVTIRRVRISQQLRYVLGFEEEVFEHKFTEARYPPDLHGGIHSLYVYAPNLVEPSLIGDVMAPLLRITKVKGSPGEMIEETYATPQYHRIMEKQISEISIQIRTASGRLVPFNWGDVILVLHFKKASPF